MMKKYLFTLLFFVGIGLNAFSTTYTSAQNGNWTNPTTWSPLGVPLSGDIVTITHSVTLDTDLAFNVGSITINSGGSLNDDVPFSRDIWMNGVNVSITNNNGGVRIRNLLISAGTLTNKADFAVKVVANFGTIHNLVTSGGHLINLDSLYNDGLINNEGIITINTFFNNDVFNNYGNINKFGGPFPVDSMYNAGTFLNDVGALIIADSCTNSGTFTNNGTLEYMQVTNLGTFTNNDQMNFDDLTNMGTFNNNATLVGSKSLWNNEIFWNNSSASLSLAVSFLNSDSTGLSGAVFNNYGNVDIGDSFYNFNVINGTYQGSFSVQDTSYNSGVMTESFDFCDATPPPSSPYIDINLGTVDPLITYCTATTINEIKHIDFTIYPNPTEGYVYFGNEKQFVQVFSAEGKKIIDEYTNQINLKRFDSGIYYLMINDEKGNRIYSEKIIKE